MPKKKIQYKLLPHQKKLLNSTSSFTAMICGRGAGKSYIASLVAALKILKGERILVFAQNYKALSENLFREITNRLSELVGWDKFKFNKGGCMIRCGKGACYGLTYENIDGCRGFTEISTLILDEGAFSPPDILMVATPCMRGLGDSVKPHTYITTTPKAGSWLNLYIADHLDEIDLIQAKTTDNKFISEIEYNQMKASFTNEALLKQELDGELLNLQSENSVLAGVHYVTTMGDEPEEGLLSIGIDGSGYGKDKTVITYRIGNWYEQKCYSTLTGHDARNEIKAMLTKHPKWRLIEINIDMAYGEKYYENLSMEYDCNLINFGSSPMNDQYLNRRAEMYFNMICGLRKGLPINEQIQKELNATLFEFTNNGKLKLVNKEEIKLVIGHSPDQSDSLALTFANGDKSKEGYAEDYEDPTLLWNPYD